MLQKRLLDIALEKYRWAPHHFSDRDVCYAATSKTAYRRNEYDEDCLLIEKDEIPSKKVLQKAQFLWYDIKKPTIANYISEMVNLEFLRIRTRHIPNIGTDSLPKSVKFLALLNEEPCTKAVSFPKVALPNVLGFWSFNSISLTVDQRIDGHLDISAEHFPNLQYLRCSLDSGNKAAQMIGRFEKLQHLCVEGVNTIDIFEHLHNKLTSLHIEGAGKGFELSKAAKIPNLKFVRFNSIHNTVNCEDFLAMPNLEEIFIYNSHKLHNVEALLESDSLRSFELLNCKGALNKDLKTKFKKHDKLKRLAIDYA